MAPDDARAPLVVPLIRREIRLLILLSIAAAVLFGATRALAGWTSEVNGRAAADFYRAGQAAAARGDTAAAVAAFRRAMAADRTEPRYTLALAETLAIGTSRAEAARLFARLREARPDDIEINLWLGRIAAADGDVSQAVRYFNHAMYGVQGLGEPRDRFQLRSELIRLLLEAGDPAHARAELAALARDAADTAAAHVTVANLAESAGDSSLGYREFQRAAALDRQSADAAAGLGRAALRRFEFGLAERSFTSALRLRPDDTGVAEALARVRLVRSLDPLAPGLRLPERSRRATAGAAWASARLTACATPADPSLTAALDGARRQGARADTDDIADVVAQIARAVSSTSGCAVSDPAASAWPLIADAHRDRAR